MPYYRTCPYCGANLDPGELCDCRKALEAEALRLIGLLSEEQRAELWEEIKEEIKNAPASVDSTDGDRVEAFETTVSTSYDSRNMEDLQV